MTESTPDQPTGPYAAATCDAGMSDSGAAIVAAPKVKLLLSAKLVSDNREVLCIVRELSGDGVSVNLLGPPPLQKQLHLEMTNGRRFPLNVERIKGNLCHLGFVQAGDPETFLAETQHDRTRRPIRLRTSQLAFTVVAGVRFRSDLCDISPYGAGIRSDKLLHVGETISFEPEALPAVPATVVWRRRDRYGLSFIRPYSLAQITEVFSPPRR